MARQLGGRTEFAFLAFVMLAAWPGTSKAMEATCAGCLDNCCAWAFSAQAALYGSYWQRMPIDDYSWKHWEQYGFPPAPCREVLHNAAEYQRCVTKAFDRCYKERCKGCGVPWNPFTLFKPDYNERQTRGISGTKPVVLHSGQVTVIERVARRPDDSRGANAGDGSQASEDEIAPRAE